MDESSDSDDVKRVSFKVVVLGDGAVGKSSLCNRFCKDFFAREYKQTLGLDFFSQSLNLPDRHVTFNLFDIGGQSLQSKLLKTYSAGADAVLFVYDMTASETLESLPEWQKLSGLIPECKSYLIGNKADLATKRTVHSSAVEAMAAKLNVVKTYQVSALTGDRIQMMFVSLAGALTGVNVEKLMLEERKVVEAIVKEEDQKTAANINEQKTVITQTKKQEYQVVKGGELVGLKPTVIDVKQVEVKKKRSLCGGM